MSKRNKQPAQLPLQKTLKRSQNFNYSKGAVNLNFTLSLDETKQLTDFRECLIEAVKDIDNILEPKN